MCTEEIGVYYPILYDFETQQLREYRASATKNALSVNALIDTIKDTLVAAGWTLEAVLAADGGIAFPAFPTEDCPAIVLGGTAYGPGCPYLPCAAIGTGPNAGSLADGISSRCSLYFAKAYIRPISPLLGPIPVVVLVAGNDGFNRILPEFGSGDYPINRDQLIGTVANNPAVYVPATYSPYYDGGPTADVANGGYRLSSRVVFGSWDGTAPVGATNQLMVEITENFAGHVQFKFFNPGGSKLFSTIGSDREKVFAAYESAHGPTTGGISYEGLHPYVWQAPGPNPVYVLHGGGAGARKAGTNAVAATPVYRIIATPYSFCMYDLANADAQGDGALSGGNSIFAMAPAVDPAKMPALITSRAIIGPGQLMGATVWGSRLSSFALNYFYRTFTNSFTGKPGIATGIYPFSQPLLATNGKPLAFNAYLMAPLEGAAYEGTDAGEARVIGQIWDGLVLSKSYAKGTRFTFDSHRFECVSTQSGAAASSLWLAI